jgi:serine/threonine-protein kinase RsbW
MQTVATSNLSLPADLSQLHHVSSRIVEIMAKAVNLAEPDVASYNIQLAVQELCVNIVNHAYAGAPGGQIQLTLTLTRNPQRLMVELKDQGKAFDPALVTDPDLSMLHEHGYGMFLIRQLIDEVDYQNRNGANFWRLVKNL